MEITFQCKACHTTYAVGENLAGRVGECHKCGQRFQIPYKSPVVKLGSDAVRQPTHEERLANVAATVRGGGDPNVPLISNGRTFEEYEPLRKLGMRGKLDGARDDPAFCPLPGTVNDVWLPAVMCVVTYGASLFLVGHYILGSYGVGAGLVIAAVAALIYWAGVVPLTLRVTEAAADSFGVRPTNALSLQVIASLGLPVYGILFGMFARGTQGAVLAGAGGALLAALALAVMLQTSAAKSIQTGLMTALCFAFAAAATALAVWGVAVVIVPRWGLNLPWVKPPGPLLVAPVVW